MSNTGKHVIATAKDNYGKRSDGVPPSVLVGTVTDESFFGATSFVMLDLDNTTTSIAVDYDEWEWKEIP